MMAKPGAIGGLQGTNRPFKARGSRVVRCNSCLMPEKHCICSYRQLSFSNIRFWLLMHRKEQFKPTNTGRLILDTIGGSSLSIWDRVQPPEPLINAINTAPNRFALMFPGDPDTDRSPLEWSSGGDGQLMTIIIPDGTWRQASRMVNKSPYLAKLPRIGLWKTVGSEYQLRKSNNNNQLCTAEVAIEVLKQCNEQQQTEILSSYFSQFNRSYSQARRGIRSPIDLEANKQLQ